ncbi:MAG: phosphoribosylaminoimidazolesuccinocarboxamide synthase [bacterium]|nr:phosphoribosylaminoimidazolesuccinocarboxamide synthase [bacterium]
MVTLDQLQAVIPNALEGVTLDGVGEKMSGKVRDSYALGDKRILITTDRISAFDRILGLIPYKGQVLNQLSLWWFEQTRDIVSNHVVDAPDVNVTIAKEAKSLPIEVVVRGYLTGVTSTSMWTMYANGERTPYGISLPDGMKKNDRLPTPVITPTTKAADGGHDERLTRDEIISQQIVPTALWEQIEQVALALFARGQQLADEAGLILVDTKYEFGTINGQLTLIDEIHTPDSSRYWVKSSYTNNPSTPEHFDKEYLRLWFAERGYKGEGIPPIMPPDFIAQVAHRYIRAYEQLTKRAFVMGDMPIAERITRNMRTYISGL